LKQSLLPAVSCLSCVRVLNLLLKANPNSSLFIRVFFLSFSPLLYFQVTDHDKLVPKSVMLNLRLPKDRIDEGLEKLLAAVPK